MQVFQDKVLFVTGNSRSGTTMMMRILDSHSIIHTINESQFFEKHWSAADEFKSMKNSEAYALCNALISRQRMGFFAHPRPDAFKNEIENILSTIEGNNYHRSEVYNAFIRYEARVSGKSIPCEKTPQNVFYIKEILAMYPNARIIHMVRDPRSILLSQKKKWKRKFLGNAEIPWKEVLRLRINYHPFTISKLWNSSANAYEQYAGDSRIIKIKFENLTDNPELAIEKLCDWLSIESNCQLKTIPHASSSTQQDATGTGIKLHKQKWLENLSATEIYICQVVCRNKMKTNGYDPISIKPNLIYCLILVLSFPFKLILSLLMNLTRMRNVYQTISKRLITS